MPRQQPRSDRLAAGFQAADRAAKQLDATVNRIGERMARLRPFGGDTSPLRKAEQSLDQFADRAKRALERPSKLRPLAPVADGIKADMRRGEAEITASLARVAKEMQKSNSVLRNILKGVSQGFGAAVGKSLFGALFGGGGGGAMGAGGGAGMLGNLFHISELAENVQGVAAGTARNVRGRAGRAGAPGVAVSQADKNAVDHIAKSAADVSRAFDTIAVKWAVALAPAFTMGADLILKFLDRMKPTIDRVLARFEVFAYVVVEVFGVVLDVVADVIESIEGWAAETLGLADTTQGAGDQMFQVLRTVGKGFAYVWDTVKAGAGVVSWVAGKIVQALGWVVKKLSEAIEFAARLADSLPAEIKTRIGLDGWGRAAEAVKGFGGEAQGVGKQMEEWGEKQIASWGQSVGRFEEWFNGVEQRFRDRKEELAKPIANTQPKLAGAAMKNSAEAYSIVAKFNAGNTMAASDTKRQIQLLQEAVKLLREQVQIERNRPAVGVF